MPILNGPVGENRTLALEGGAETGLRWLPPWDATRLTAPPTAARGCVAPLVGAPPPSGVEVGNTYLEAHLKPRAGGCRLG